MLHKPADMIHLQRLAALARARLLLAFSNG